MADIFISYASADRPRAKVLAEAFEQHGWSIWWDRKISIGNVFDKEIEQALGASRCVIVLWSRASVASEWVREEAHEGKRRGILVPILLDHVKIPMGLGLRQTANIADWQPGVPHPDFDHLISAITRILQSPPTMQAKYTTGAKSPEVKRSAREVVSASPKPKPRSIPGKMPSTVITKPRNRILNSLKLYWPLILATSAVFVLPTVIIGLQSSESGNVQELVDDGVAEEKGAAAAEMRLVRIGSDPQANLYLERNGVRTGPYKTPYAFRAPFGERVSWELQRNGYQTRTDAFTVQVTNDYNSIPLEKLNE